MIKKKAIIDQILLGLFIFVVLVVIGATISDNTEARDKYYNLKKITDNAVLTVAKCYINVEPDIDKCKKIYYDMLPLTDLGTEVQNSVVFDPIDLSADTIKIIARIDDYKQETFWFKFIDLIFFNLNVYSELNIESHNSPDTTTSTYSYGIAPFAINLDNYKLNQSLALTYDLVSNWDFSIKDKFYPVMPSSVINNGVDCNEAYILSTKYKDKKLSYEENWASVGSETYGFDLTNFDWTNTNCTEIGNDLFVHYADDVIPEVVTSSLGINFGTEIATDEISLLGTYEGNEFGTMNPQQNQMHDVFKSFTYPIQLDIITLDYQGKPNGVVRVEISDYNSKKDKTITINTKIVGSEYKTYKLIH